MHLCLGLNPDPKKTPICCCRALHRTTPGPSQPPTCYCLPALHAAACGCRLLTLAGLRRRGVPPAAINAFCREIGITRNANVIPLHRLEHHVRTHLDATSARTLAVLRPLRVRKGAHALCANNRMWSTDQLCMF